MKSFLWITICFIVLSAHLSISLKERIRMTEIYHYVHYGVLDVGRYFYYILSNNNPTPRNLVFSPYALYTFLAQLYLGSDGDATNILASILALPHPETRHKPNHFHQSLQNDFSRVRSGMLYKSNFPNGTAVNLTLSDLKITNEVFLHWLLSRKESYLKSANLYYNSSSGISEIYFRHNIEKDNRTIDKYTELLVDKIHESLQHPQGRLFYPVIFHTATYFKAVWQQKFNKSLTKNETFTQFRYIYRKIVPMTEEITVEMMRGVVRAQFAELPKIGVTVLGLKSIDEQFTMYIALPFENQTLDDFGANIYPIPIEQLLDQDSMTYVECEVDVKLPKFEFKWSRTIKKDLVKLGLGENFFKSRELRNMFEYSNINITEIHHTAEIKVDEDGIGDIPAVDLTYSAENASTLGNSDLPKVQFYANRSFFFLHL